MASEGRDRDRGERGGDWTESVVAIRRCAAVVKGGRRFSFNALVVVGNGRGQVAWGYGKANEVPPAVEKGVKDAHKQMNRVHLKGGTIPHRVIGRYGAARVVMLPADGEYFAAFSYRFRSSCSSNPGSASTGGIDGGTCSAKIWRG